MDLRSWAFFRPIFGHSLIVIVSVQHEFQDFDWDPSRPFFISFIALLTSCGVNVGGFILRQFWCWCWSIENGVRLVLPLLLAERLWVNSVWISQW